MIKRIPSFKYKLSRFLKIIVFLKLWTKQVYFPISTMHFIDQIIIKERVHKFGFSIGFFKVIKVYH